MKNTIIITGAAGTIGQATASSFHALGYHVFLVDNKKEPLEKLAAKLKNTTSILIDVTNPQAIANLFDLASDSLVNVVLAAGIEGPVATVVNCSDASFQTVLNTNVMSVWLGIKHGLRILTPKETGNIVVLSSVSGIAAAPMLSAYCASKHAVIGLVKTAACEAAAYNIRINAVCPGPVKSSMMERIDYEFITQGHIRSNITQAIPMKRYATPQEIANMILFLCSNASSYCTGSVMMVDGGFTCK